MQSADTHCVTQHQSFRGTSILPAQLDKPKIPNILKKHKDKGGNKGDELATKDGNTQTEIQKEREVKKKQPRNLLDKRIDIVTCKLSTKACPFQPAICHQ